MTQIEAKKFCEEEQQVPAHLIEIDSTEENRAIVAEIKRQNFLSRKINFWLGITDPNNEGNWVLESTGESVVFTDWNYGAWNHGNCAHISSWWIDQGLARGQPGAWHSVYCNGKPNIGWMRTALCEM